MFNLFKKKSVSAYKLNWLPSPPDPRDFKFSAILTKRDADIPPPTKADISESIPEVFDQGHVGSCTGNAGAMLGLFRSRAQGREIMPSRLMLYYGARELEGETEFDNGAYIRDIFKAWAKRGSAPESVWPYDESKVTTQPSAEAYSHGKNTLATSYHSLNNSSIDELKRCIALGSPFEFGFTVYRQFLYGSWADTMPMPKQGEEILGGHAVTAVAYDDARQAFRIKNSWGREWKDGGCFWMPYSFITNATYCDDFWVLLGVTPGDKPAPTPSNITSIVDLKRVFKSSKDFKCMNEAVLVRIGKEMGLNASETKSKSENIAIVLGGLGI